MAVPSILQEAYSPANFRKEAYQLVDLLADHLEASLSGRSTQMFPNQTPEAQLDQWQQFLQNPDPSQFFSRLLENAIHVHHPHYMGHQVSVPVPYGAMTTLMSGMLNNGMAVFEMGPAVSAMERIILQQFAQAIGWARGADGVLTSGGTLANLTALLTVRSVQVPGDAWQDGTSNNLALLVSEEAHYCIDRAVRIMGWGSEGIIKVPVDDQFRIRIDALESCWRAATDAGKKVIAVVGSACSTATGSFDDLEGIADFCAAKDLWFHLDAAHGGAAIFSEQYRSLLAGAERADSIIMDFHKMGAAPALSTALLFRNGAHSFRTFAQKADYLYTEQGEEWHNIGKRTFECTKTMMSAWIFGIMQRFGSGLFRAYVDRCFGQGKLLAQMIKERSRLELLVEPECNIVVFRATTTHKDPDELNALNRRIKHQLNAEGQHYIVTTIRNGVQYLRCTVMNPFSEESHFKALLDRIEQLQNN
jgi:L-2,4-diaminobutyrate decarboxylase